MTSIHLTYLTASGELWQVLDVDTSHSSASSLWWNTVEYFSRQGFKKKMSNLFSSQKKNTGACAVVHAFSYIHWACCTLWDLSLFFESENSKRKIGIRTCAACQKQWRAHFTCLSPSKSFITRVRCLITETAHIEGGKSVFSYFRCVFSRKKRVHTHAYKYDGLEVEGRNFYIC